LKKANEILNTMLALPGCLPGLVDEEKCRHKVDVMVWEAKMVQDYWAYQVTLLGVAAEGKAEDTTEAVALKDAKNKHEAAGWTVDGIA